MVHPGLNEFAAQPLAATLHGFVRVIELGEPEITGVQLIDGRGKIPLGGEERLARLGDEHRTAGFIGGRLGVGGEPLGLGRQYDAELHFDERGIGMRRVLAEKRFQQVLGFGEYAGARGGVGCRERRTDQVAGLAMDRAVGTSLLVIAMQSFAGFFGHLGHVAIDWPLTLAVTAMAVVGSFVGGSLAGRVPPAQLRRAFGVFVLLMAAIVVAKELG